MRFKTFTCPNRCEKPESQQYLLERNVGLARMVLESHLIRRNGKYRNSMEKWDLVIDYICPVCKTRKPATWEDVRRISRAAKCHI